MEVKNISNYPKLVSGEELMPGETVTVDNIDEEDVGRNLEVLEKSGDSGSDQNTKTENLESEESENGGE